MKWVVHSWDSFCFKIFLRFVILTFEPKIDLPTADTFWCLIKKNDHISPSEICLMICINGICQSQDFIVRFPRFGWIVVVIRFHIYYSWSQSSRSTWHGLIKSAENHRIQPEKGIKIRNKKKKRLLGKKRSPKSKYILSKRKWWISETTMNQKESKNFLNSMKIRK